MTEIVATACPTHHTTVVEGTWDAAEQVKRLPSPMLVSVARRVYGYYDGAQVEGGQVIKGACKLPHHQVAADGTPGAAVAAGVRNALARLPQSDIPTSEHADIRAHLRAHLDDMQDKGKGLAVRHRVMKIARPVARLREGRADWYRITTNKADGAECWIYDEIGYFGLTASDFIQEFNEIDRDRITVHINSPGGEIFDGVAIYEAMRQHPAEITTKIDSLAASIASVIAMGGDHRMVARNAQMMIHDGHTVAIGNAKDLREQADLLDRMSDNIADIYSDRCGGTKKKWRDLMLAETWYSAREAVDAGLADEVSGTSSAKNDWDLSIFCYTGRAQAPAPQRIDPDLVDLDTTMITDALRGAFA